MKPQLDKIRAEAAIFGVISDVTAEKLLRVIECQDAALSEVQEYIHTRSCMEHEVCATSHSMECDDARQAQAEVLRILEGTV